MVGFGHAETHNWKLFLNSMNSLQPADCRPLIERLKVATEENLLSELTALKSWSYGKVRLISDRRKSVLVDCHDRHKPGCSAIGDG